MGLIRLFMALSVVVWHVGGVAGWLPYNASACVTLFFIISGFYMALILNEKYVGKGSNVVFWLNRFLRLWPTYVVAVAVTFPLAPKIFAHLYNETNGSAFFVILLSNLTMLGNEMQDLLCIANDGRLQICEGAHQIRTGSYFLVPQAWSVGLEIWFYLAAPWMVRRWSTTAIFLVVGALFFVTARLMDLENQWIYQFFPPMLLFFMLGALAYYLGKFFEWKSYRKAYERLGSHIVLPLVLLAIAMPDILLSWLPAQHHNKLLSALFVLFIPAWFSWSKRHRWDTGIGDLSYPIYMIHLAVLEWTLKLVGPTAWTGVMTIVGSLIAAMILLHSLERPIDEWRHMKQQRLVKGCAAN